MAEYGCIFDEIENRNCWEVTREDVDEYKVEEWENMIGPGLSFFILSYSNMSFK